LLGNAQPGDCTRVSLGAWVWTWYAVVLSFCSSFFFVGLGQRPYWNVSLLYFGFLAEWSSHLAEDSIEWAFFVCDSSFLCNPLESKGGIDLDV
jgi:hypothetical protein